MRQAEAPSCSASADTDHGGDKEGGVLEKRPEHAAGNASGPPPARRLVPTREVVVLRDLVETELDVHGRGMTTTEGAGDGPSLPCF